MQILTFLILATFGASPASQAEVRTEDFRLEPGDAATGAVAGSGTASP